MKAQRPSFGDRKPVPPHLRHRIVPMGDQFALQTCYGYVLDLFPTEQEARTYYAEHCPEI